MENKFQVGERVYAKATPSLKLVIRRYALRIYYCQIQNVKESKDLVFYERELDSSSQINL